MKGEGRGLGRPRREGLAFGRAGVEKNACDERGIRRFLDYEGV
jgi:hypothetical protein